MEQINKLQLNFGTSRAVAFKCCCFQLNQPIRFDLYQESTSTSNQTIHQDMDGCESVGSTNVEDLLARKRETETRLVQTSDLDLGRADGITLDQ